MSEEQETKLVQKGELDSALSEILTREKNKLEDLKACLPHLRDKKMQKTFLKDIAKSEKVVAALETGFVPIDIGWVANVEPKRQRSFTKRLVKETMDEMPPEVHDAMERVKQLGVFDSLAVTPGGTRDPVLVGMAGGKQFFIASWLVMCEGKRAIGMVAPIPQVRK